MGESLSHSDSPMLELTGRIMVVAVIILFVVVASLFFLHLYSKWFWYGREEDATTTVRTRRRRRLDFAAGHQELSIVTGLRHGLDPSALKSIPVVVFSPKDFKDGLECAVCLCEVSKGEKARLLPKCNHGFHVDCIDMWFQSHSTCPLCRNPVSNQSSSKSTTLESETTLETILQEPIAENSSVNGYSNESPNFPTNVLFWGNETQVSTFGTGLEERQINEEEEPKSPVTTRLRSLKRLLSRDRRAGGPCSPSSVDVEQGSRGHS
ncbi:unnamed protein product [Ilex paraguariensis]|uniref:RING-type E3 ubiquitin transferase n=1 Tax=Ilex paraguariensis TaxID=185542 RepID=A0ABC8RI90_9AQUA